jgi:hypothetical protein
MFGELSIFDPGPRRASASSGPCELIVAWGSRNLPTLQPKAHLLGNATGAIGQLTPLNRQFVGPIVASHRS